ncbi:DUF432 domain-containing protein [Alteromonas sp. BMJM2]|uniref:DUF432 domain-containing protein n=1 Tax=Alteromonas sp. BMJM2 TaxID=2954241 RepID=UPI0022B59210|nr:DUF432 domain-containing protein [Alteromonas sp. BMJM2]
MWWGQFNFDEQETKCWRVGDRLVAIRRSEHEWSVWNKETTQELDKPIQVNKLKARESLKEIAIQRFMVSNTSTTLVIEPSLADRAMVVRPNKPFFVMPEEEINIFVSTPLWMTLLLPKSDIPLTDIPFWRPSDSWFGPSTMSGDLCYSKYTDAKMDNSLLEKRPHRASTMVTLKNEQDEPLRVERLNLPVPALKLYTNQNGDFWSDQVSILQIKEHGKSISHVRHNPPEKTLSLELVSESRELSNKPSFLSSIKSLVD